MVVIVAGFLGIVVGLAARQPLGAFIAGFLGIVVGLAARQPLGAFIAGFVLMLSRPFEIGDWVDIGEQEGIVTDITIVNARLRNFDGEYVSIPNDRVADSVVVAGETTRNTARDRGDGSPEP